MSGETPESEETRPLSADPTPHPPSSSLDGARPHTPTHGHAHLPNVVSQFLERLKRRNVGRVAILYIVVCYVILEPFEMFFHLLDLPAWTGRTVVLLMVLGFPAALLFAWIYEITPEGIKPAAEVDPGRSIARHTGRKLDFAIIAVLAFALIYFVADKFWISKRVAAVSPAPIAAPAAVVSVPASPTIPEKSVAVLPFVDMSEKKDQEYFSDGMAEEIIDLLVKVPELRVPARTSAFSFKGKSDDIPTIARKLLVANVLEGSVRKSGKHLRVTVQLIRADNGYHLWSDTYDRDLNDIFKVQDEIAGAVVDALKVKLRTGLSFVQPSAPNPDAHALFLQGKFLLRRLNNSDTKQALTYLQQAVDLDPNYAPAWSWLSVVYETLGAYRSMSWDEACGKQQFAAERAAELDPTLADARVNIAAFHIDCDQDWAAAKANLTKALELDPGDARAWGTLGTLALSIGEPAEAIKDLERAASFDPLRPSTYSVLIAAYEMMGRWKDAEIAVRKVLELAPAGEGYHSELGLILLSQGQADAALLAIEQERDETSRLSARSIAFRRLGRYPEADKALADLVDHHTGDALMEIAEVYADRGEPDRAFEWLQRAHSDRSPGFNDINGDPRLLSLRKDPRFKELLRKMHLPD
jgi:adenylate cyclase